MGLLLLAVEHGGPCSLALGDHAHPLCLHHPLHRRVEAFLETILPLLFFCSEALVRPVWVFSFLPLNTAALARLPLAITLTLFAFITRFIAVAPALFMPTCF